MNSRFFLLSLICALLANMQLYAQMPYREIYSSWEEFLEHYAEDENLSQDELEHLNILHQQPLNLNVADKETLLQLPFLTEQQVDSLIAYREMKRQFLTLGELQFISGWDTSTRKFTSLFTYIGDTIRTPLSLIQKLTKGNHLIETRIDIPTYKREGEKRESGGYLGNGIKNVMRYRYAYRNNITYGITLEKDAGEPFASQGNNPYDYFSFYGSYNTENKKHKLFFGDYTLHFGEGLLLGKSPFAGQLSLLQPPSRNTLRIRSHTGTNEYYFFRGLAYSYTHRKMRLTAFASYRSLDAKIEHNGVSTLYTDGAHRTYAELKRKNSLGNATLGVLLERAFPTLRMGVAGYFSSYDKTIEPLPRPYNRYALKGDVAAGTALTYASQSASPLSLSGELAADRRFHLAFSHRFHYKVTDDLRLSAQIRWFSKRFVAPWAQTINFASRVNNERGICVGAAWRGAKGVDIEAYADAHQFPFSTYRAEKSSHGAKAYLQVSHTSIKGNTALLRYTYRLWQQNATGRKGRLEYRGKHRVRLQYSLHAPHFSLTSLVEGCATHAQTQNPAFGFTTALRGLYQYHPKGNISVFGALFFTDDYASAVYAYEPLLPSMYSFGALYYKGARLVAQTKYTWNERFTLGGRYGVTRYFNKETIGSGLQEINGATKGDFSVYLRIKL